MSLDIRTEFTKQFGEMPSLISPLGISEEKKGALERKIFQIVQGKEIQMVAKKFDNPGSLLPTVIERLIRRNLEWKDAAALGLTGTLQQKAFEEDRNYKYLELAKKHRLQGIFSTTCAQQEVMLRIERDVAILKKLYPPINLGTETDLCKQLQLFQKLNKEGLLEDALDLETFGQEIFFLPPQSKREYVDRICLAVADVMAGQKKLEISSLPVVFIELVVDFCSSETLQILVNLAPPARLNDPANHRIAFLLGFMHHQTTWDVDQKLEIILNKLIENERMGGDKGVGHGVKIALRNLVAEAAVDEKFERHLKKFVSINPLFRLNATEFAKIPNSKKLSKDLTAAVVLPPQV